MDDMSESDVAVSWVEFELPGNFETMSPQTVLEAAIDEDGTNKKILVLLSNTVLGFLPNLGEIDSDITSDRAIFTLSRGFKIGKLVENEFDLRYRNRKYGHSGPNQFVMRDPPPPRQGEHFGPFGANSFVMRDETFSDSDEPWKYSKENGQSLEKAVGAIFGSPLSVTLGIRVDKDSFSIGAATTVFGNLVPYFVQVEYKDLETTPISYRMSLKIERNGKMMTPAELDQLLREIEEHFDEASRPQTALADNAVFEDAAIQVHRTNY